MRVSEFPAKKAERINYVVNYIKGLGLPLDPLIIANHFGVEVNFIKGQRHPLAFTAPIVTTNKAAIYLSDDVDKYSKKILLFHELGHILCNGRCETYLFDHTIDHEGEYMANMFMASFLPVLANKEITDNTDILAVNRYISTKIRIPSKHSFDGQLSLFDFYWESIPLDDKYWLDKSVWEPCIN